MKSTLPRLILASASPRRLDLLRQIRYTPDLVIPTAIDEAPQPREMPQALALRLARAKAMAVAPDYPKDFVLGADTVVACGRRILPKAETEEEARQCLSLLSGRRHRVYGGICVIAPIKEGIAPHVQRLARSDVLFKRLSTTEMATYLATGEWHGKAGGYAIQGMAAAFVKRLAGSYSNVVGLSLYDVVSVLQGLGYAPALGLQASS
ncbi:MAG: Maf family nucleotide pyrophosphatase [Alphaproteobacteria bacterium]